MLNRYNGEKGCKFIIVHKKPYLTSILITLITSITDATPEVVERSSGKQGTPGEMVVELTDTLCRDKDSIYACGGGRGDDHVDVLVREEIQNYAQVVVVAAAEICIYTQDEVAVVIYICKEEVLEVGVGTCR